MRKPTELTVVKEGAEYIVPTYFVTEQGLQDGAGLTIKFCKGSRDDENIPRQEGVVTESMIELCLQSIVSVNIGQLRDEYSERAVMHIKEALKAVQERQADRRSRGVQGTYKA